MVHKSWPTNRVIITSNKQFVGLMCSDVFATFLFVSKTYGMYTGDKLYFIRVYSLFPNISSELLSRYDQKRLWVFIRSIRYCFLILTEIGVA
jgi:hypothetical protein